METDVDAIRQQVRAAELQLAQLNARLRLAEQQATCSPSTTNTAAAEPAGPDGVASPPAFESAGPSQVEPAHDDHHVSASAVSSRLREPEAEHIIAPLSSLLTRQKRSGRHGSAPSSHTPPSQQQPDSPTSIHYAQKQHEHALPSRDDNAEGLFPDDPDDDEYDQNHQTSVSHPLPNDSRSPPTAVERVSDPIIYPLTHDLVTLEVKQIWPSLGDIKAAVESHALAQGWTSATKKRDRTRICMGCRSTPNCPYHLRAETCAEGARIAAYKPGHTCVGKEETRKRKQVSYMRFLRDEIPRLMPDVTAETPVGKIQEAVFRAHGKRIAPGQCLKFKAMLPQEGRRRIRTKTGQLCKRCHRPGHNMRTCKGELPEHDDLPVQTVHYDIPGAAVE